MLDFSVRTIACDHSEDFTTPPEKSIRAGFSTPVDSPAPRFGRMMSDSDFDGPLVYSVASPPGSADRRSSAEVLVIPPGSPRKLMKCGSASADSDSRVRDLLESPKRGLPRRRHTLSQGHPANSGHRRTASMDHNVRINPFSPTGVSMGTCDVTRYASPARSRCGGTPRTIGMGSPRAPSAASPHMSPGMLPLPSAGDQHLQLPEGYSCPPAGLAGTPTYAFLHAASTSVRRAFYNRSGAHGGGLGMGGGIATPAPESPAASSPRSKTAPNTPRQYEAPSTPPQQGTDVDMNMTATRQSTAPAGHLSPYPVPLPSPKKTPAAPVHAPVVATAGACRHRYFKYWGANACAGAGSDPNANNFCKQDATIHEDAHCVVYKVIRDLDGMFYCVKALKEDLTPDNQEVFLAEVRALVACQAYGALRYVDSFVEQKMKRGRPVQRLHIVTELMFPLRYIDPKQLFELSDGDDAHPEDDASNANGAGDASTSALFRTGTLERMNSTDHLGMGCMDAACEDMWTFADVPHSEQAHVAARVIDIGESVKQTLRGLHAAGSVHRDVSLDSVVATSKPGSGVVCRLGVFQNVLEHAEARPEFALLKKQDFFLLGLTLLELLGCLTAPEHQYIRESDVFLLPTDRAWDAFLQDVAGELDVLEKNNALPATLTAYLRGLMVQPRGSSADGEDTAEMYTGDHSAVCAHIEFLEEAIAREERRMRMRAKRAQRGSIASTRTIPTENSSQSGNLDHDDSTSAADDPAACVSGFAYAKQRYPADDDSISAASSGESFYHAGRGGMMSDDDDYGIPLYDRLEGSMSMSVTVPVLTLETP